MIAVADCRDVNRSICTEALSYSMHGVQGDTHAGEWYRSSCAVETEDRPDPPDQGTCTTHGMSFVWRQQLRWRASCHQQDRAGRQAEVWL